MKRRNSILVLVAALVLVATAGMVSAGRVIPIISNNSDGHYLLAAPQSLTTWKTTVPWWQVWNIASGQAYAQLVGGRARLETMAMCEPGASSFTAKALASYKWESGLPDGFVSLTVDSTIWGELQTFPTGGTGNGKGKVTLKIIDKSAGSTAVMDETLMSEDAPTYTGVLQGEPLTNLVDGRSLSIPKALYMKKNHIYEAAVTLESKCMTNGFYTIRSDFSRNTPDLIGMYSISGLTFDW